MRLMTRLIAPLWWAGGASPVLRASKSCASACNRARRTRARSAGASSLRQERAIEVCREMGREGLPVIALRAGEQKRLGRPVRRSHFMAAEEHRRGYPSALLARQDGARSAIGCDPRCACPPALLPTLPAFRAGGRIVSVPPLGFHVASYRPAALRRDVYLADGRAWLAQFLILRRAIRLNLQLARLGRAALILVQDQKETMHCGPGASHG